VQTGEKGARVIREGKVPSAYFLEQVDAKGMRNGDIRVADYHANLIYNAGQGTARELWRDHRRTEGSRYGPVWGGTRRGGSVRRVPGERERRRVE